MSQQLESCELSGRDAPLTDTTATQPQAAILSPPVVSEQLESCKLSGGDAPLTDTTATQPQAAILSPPVVSEQLESCELSGGDAPLTDTLPLASVPSPPVVRNCLLSIVQIYIQVGLHCYELLRSLELSCTCVQICRTHEEIQATSKDP